MIDRRPSSRWALWLFAAALLLKAAMPWLAGASAQWQGKSLVEVCTVYGVSLQPLDGSPAAPSSGDHVAHAEAHCALNGLAAWAAPVAPLPAPTAAPLPWRSAGGPPATPGTVDRCAAWVARLQHGPPAAA